MAQRTLARPLRRAAFATGLLGLLVPLAGAQTSFSIDNDSLSVSLPDCAGVVALTEADILQACTPGGVPAWGPLPVPVISIPGGFVPAGLGLALHAGCVGHAPGVPCGIEVDAMSFGMDGILANINYTTKGKLAFSVDRCSGGIPGIPVQPNVWTEGMPFPISDAAADVFHELRLPMAAFPIAGIVGGNTGGVDGNGLVSLPTFFPTGFAYPGLGLIEASPFPVPPVLLDNLDALDMESLPAGTFPPGGVYFSLDSFYPFLCHPGAGAVSGPAHGFSAADVVVTPVAGAAPVLYAPAAALGLDFAGPSTDDIDAIALFENGAAGFQPSLAPFDWLAGGTDMLLYSVRRGSAIVGVVDGCSGLPISPGDILTTPPGGIGPPCILVPAEAIGLNTLRSGGPVDDDLDALDVMRTQPGLFAHNACYGVACPCGNVDPTAGCVNSTGVGGFLSATAGSSSIALDDLVLTATQLPPNNNGLFYMGNAIVNNLFFDGIQCALGTTFRFLGSIQNTGAAGTMVMGPGIAAASAGLIVPGSTWYFQAWHRDVAPVGPCGTGANLTNATGVCFQP